MLIVLLFPREKRSFFPIRCIDTCQYIYKVNNQIGHDFIFCHPCVRALPLPKVSVVPWNTHHYVIVTKVIDLIIYWHRSLMTPSKQEIPAALMIWKPLTASSLNLIACFFCVSLYLKIHLQVWFFLFHQWNKLMRIDKPRA